MADLAEAGGLQEMEPDPVLLARAGVLQAESEGVADCWNLLMRGLEAGWIDRDELDALIGRVARWADYGVEELLFDFRDGRVEVRFLDESACCDPDALHRALVWLRS